MSAAGAVQHNALKAPVKVVAPSRGVRSSELLEGESTSTSVDGVEPEWTSSPWGSPAVSASTPQIPGGGNSDGASKMLATTLPPDSKLPARDSAPLRGRSDEPGVGDAPQTPPVPPPHKAPAPSPSRYSPPPRRPPPSSNAHSNDEVHCVLMELADEFPIVQTFQRINTGFYKVEGMGTCELSLSRTGEKLHAKLDGWNRGVRGDLIKFLQSISPEQEITPPLRTGSDGNLSKPPAGPTSGKRVSVTSQRRTSDVDGSGTGGSGAPAASVSSKPPARAPMMKPEQTSQVSQNRISKSPRHGGPRLSGVSAPAAKASAARSGNARGSLAGRPGNKRASELRSTDSTNGAVGTAAASQQLREGSLFVCTCEGRGLVGEPCVLLRVAEDGDPTVLVRLLRDGRAAEAHVSNLQLLSKSGPRSIMLTAFEELLLRSPANLPDDRRGPSVFGHVEVGELSESNVIQMLQEYWPASVTKPRKGLAWLVRPFFYDWLKRRQRLRLFLQLCGAIELEDFEREHAIPGIDGPPLYTLSDLSERDLLVILLVVTPYAERSLLYQLAKEADMPLPLAFPSLSCKDKSELNLEDDGAVEEVDQGVMIPWEAFEALLARPSEGSLLLWLGSEGSSRTGKSCLLKELLGCNTDIVDGPASTTTWSSPIHVAGVDLVPCRAESFSWAADCHGCDPGDARWLALLAALVSSASLVVVHLTAEDFIIKTAGEDRSNQQPRRLSAAEKARKPDLKFEFAPSAAANGSVSITAKAGLIALLKTFTSELPGLGSGARVVCFLRDTNPALAQQIESGVRTCLQDHLGRAFVGLFCLETLTSLRGGARSRALSVARHALEEGYRAIQDVPCKRLPCAETLRRACTHFHDRLVCSTDHDSRIGAFSTFSPQSRNGEVLHALLDEAEAHSPGRLHACIFPASELASQFASLHEREKRLRSEADNGEVSSTSTDTALNALAAEFRQLEHARRAVLERPLSPPLQFFVEAVLGDGGRLRHAKISEFGQNLAAWRTPRLAPLMEERRRTLDKRLSLKCGSIGESKQTASAKSTEPNKSQKGVESAEAQRLSAQISALDSRIDQLSISLDAFWGEVMALSDLATEQSHMGARPPMGLPEHSTLKRLFGDWSCRLNCPIQFLRGSPLQASGQFLVDVLKDLGAQQDRELFVISVIGVQSSAKSTLLNYLFGCDFATSSGRCTRGLYATLMDAPGRQLLILDTEGLMSLEAAGGNVFDAQLALMAMACSHLVLINHKGELSRQLQDLLEVCLFAMQHLQVCRIQPRICFVLRDQHDRSPHVHSDALRLMRKHLAEASSHLDLKIDELITLNNDDVVLLPSAFASDLDAHGREKQWSTELFAREVLRLRKHIFSKCIGGKPDAGCGDSAVANGDAPEFSTLPDWCLHSMSVWRVLDRYGANLLHYKSVQEIELQKELEEMVKNISTQLVSGPNGLAEKGRHLLADFGPKLTEDANSEQVDSEFRSALQALVDTCKKQCEVEFERTQQGRKAKLPDVKKEEVKRKLQTPVEYQGELLRYTWTLWLTEAVDRDQLRALKVHFKRTVEELWKAQASQSLAEQQARQLFQEEWHSFEEKFKERFERTRKSERKFADEVCMLFNHVLRQHRHSEETLQVIELSSATTLLSEKPVLEWDDGRFAKQFLEIRWPQRLAEFAARRGDAAEAKAISALGNALSLQGGARSPGAAAAIALVETVVVPEWRKRLAPGFEFVLPGSGDAGRDRSAAAATAQSRMPSEDQLLEATRRMCTLIGALEDRFLAPLGVRMAGGRVAFMNAAHLGLRHAVHRALMQAEDQRVTRQWDLLQSHRSATEQEFLNMVQRQTSDAERAKMLAGLFHEALVKDWLERTLVGVAADIRAQCLADMPDAASAAERAYQQSFVERNWPEVLEYVLDVNAYLHKLFHNFFDERQVAISRAQRPILVARLGSLFDGLVDAAKRWGRRERGRAKLSGFQSLLQELAASARAGPEAPKSPWPVLSEGFPVVPDFDVEDVEQWSVEFSRCFAELQTGHQISTKVSESLNGALGKQKAQVWSLVKGCCETCPCCGSKCDLVGSHTVHKCSHHLLPAFNGWRVAGTREATLDTCKSQKNHDAPKRSDFSNFLYPRLEDYLKAEHPEWLPFPVEDKEILADSVLKAAWVNCRLPLIRRYDMVDSTPPEWETAYAEPGRMLTEKALEVAEVNLRPFLKHDTQDEKRA